jgi:hypothetical protein
LTLESIFTSIALWYLAMLFDRVIQDSDDDEEPSPEKPTRVSITNHVGPRGAESLRAQHEVDLDSHIGVNFDQFLQSQDAPQTNVSPAQQRREERWIPVEGRTGSMGKLRFDLSMSCNG